MSGREKEMVEMRFNDLFRGKRIYDRDGEGE